MSEKTPIKRRGRPAGTTKLPARPFVDKILGMRGFDHLLTNVGTKGRHGEIGDKGNHGKPGITAPGEFLLRLLVEGTANGVGKVLSNKQIKRAIRSRRRKPPKSAD